MSALSRIAVTGRRRLNSLLSVGHRLLIDTLAFRWLALEPFSKFLQLYTHLVAILALLVAGGFLSLFPRVVTRVLTPLIVVDLDELQNSGRRGSPIPQGIGDLIGREGGTLRIVNEPRLLEHYRDFPATWKLFDATTGRVLNVGKSRDAIPNGDVEEVERALGVPHPRPGHPQPIEDPEEIRFHAWTLAWSHVHKGIESATGKRFLPSSNSVWLENMSRYFEPGNRQQRFDVLFDFLLASRVVSLVLVENPSRLAAFDVEVFFDDAGRLDPILPKLVVGQVRSLFHYRPDSNSIWFPQIAPNEQLVIFAESKLAVEGQDVRVSWNRYSEVDSRKLGCWLSMLLLSCILVKVLERESSFRKSRSAAPP